MRGNTINIVHEQKRAIYVTKRSVGRQYFSDSIIIITAEFFANVA